MPTYVYKFLDCDGTIEVQQAFTDSALTEAVHPADGRLHPVKKVFTPVGVTFKGNGFYKTDSRGSNGPSSKANGSTPAKSESSTSESKSPAPAPTPAPAASSSD